MRVIAARLDGDECNTVSAMREMAMLRRCVLHEGVHHRRQRYDWDCGLACVQMVLPAAQSRLLADNFQQICDAEGISKSTWTIDLCYILRRFNAPHLFCTRTLGADAAYRNAAFYSNVFAVDAARVNRRFRQAENNGVCVRQAALPLGDVLMRMRRGPAIVLTDAVRLACAICKHERFGNKLHQRLSPPPSPASSYVGHYVVLCGYDLPLRVIYYRNPACHDRKRAEFIIENVQNGHPTNFRCFTDYCAMSLESFEDARRAFGTDEDIIFVELDTPS